MNRPLASSGAWICTRLAAAALMCMSSAGALAQGTQVVKKPVRRELSGPFGRETFSLSDPSAKVSVATRERLDLPARTLETTGGFKIHARVVIRSDAAVTAALVGATKGRVSALDGVPGFWILDTSSVEEAIAQCELVLRSPVVSEAYVDLERPVEARGIPTDPEYSKEWHLNNTAMPIADLNAEPAWLAGFNGAGVTVGIVEGAWDITHPDLAANYNADASQSGGSATSHATNVAGVIAEVANNGLGGAGIAWGARISKQIFGTLAQNAAALAYRNDLNWVKNSSWGPPDSDQIIKLSSVEEAALREGVTTGRGGKGTIFTWAAGNGGSGDRMDYDGYVSCRFVMPISGVGDGDTRSSFSERGSANFLVAPSGGNARSIFTTDLAAGYTTKFTGSSASAPMAAGAAAVILQANPALTWRDVQHVLVDSARRCDPANAGWLQNGAGRWVSYDYGLGAIDLGAAVQRATNWTMVAPELALTTGALPVHAALADNDAQGRTESVQVSGLLTIETVEVILNITTANVGDLEVVLVSPSGTESVLAATPRSDTSDNMVNTLFLTRRCWGESPCGEWKLRIADRKAGNIATWTDWKLNIYGARCRADVDGSGFVDLDDYALYTELYAARSQGADQNGDGVVDESDFAQFLAGFEAGCG